MYFFFYFGYTNTAYLQNYFLKLNIILWVDKYASRSILNMQILNITIAECFTYALAFMCIICAYAKAFMLMAVCICAGVFVHTSRRLGVHVCVVSITHTHTCS